MKENETKDKNDTCNSSTISDEELLSEIIDIDYVAKMKPKKRYRVTVEIKKIEEIKG